MAEIQTVITREGYEKIVKELDELKNIKRKEIAARIQDAKELGDLSENAEYSEAKNEQAFVEGRIAELENLVKTVSVVDSPVDANTVHVGSTVTVKGPHGEKTFLIVGSNEADPLTGKISNGSPLGKALIGVKVGTSVEVKTPAGPASYVIRSIQ